MGRAKLIVTLFLIGLPASCNNWGGLLPQSSPMPLSLASEAGGEAGCAAACAQVTQQARVRATPEPQADQALQHEGGRDPEAYIRMLERPNRDAYQKPGTVVQALRLSPGQVVADIGAGSGYFTMRLARAVGPHGRVYAEDVWQAMLDHIKRRMEKQGAGNVELIRGEPNDPKLPPASVDLVFICNTWHHIEDRSGFVQNLIPALKPGGRVVVIDYKKEKTPVGPPLSMRVPPQAVMADFARAGFELVSEVGILPYQYFLVFAVGSGKGAAELKWQGSYHRLIWQHRNMGVASLPRSLGSAELNEQ